MQVVDAPGASVVAGHVVAPTRASAMASVSRVTAPVLVLLADASEIDKAIRYGFGFRYAVLGLLAGFRGGWVDGFLMRLCDVMLSFPPILVALLIAGVGRALFPNAHNTVAFGVLIISITLAGKS